MGESDDAPPVIIVVEGGEEALGENDELEVVVVVRP